MRRRKPVKKTIQFASEGVAKTYREMVMTKGMPCGEIYKSGNNLWAMEIEFPSSSPHRESSR